MDEDDVIRANRRHEDMRDLAGRYMVALIESCRTAVIVESARPELRPHAQEHNGARAIAQSAWLLAEHFLIEQELREAALPSSPPVAADDDVPF
jgi:hypothetical protein